MNDAPEAAPALIRKPSSGEVDFLSAHDPFEDFFRACEEGDIATVVEHVSTSPTIMTIYSQKGWACLHYISFFGFDAMLVEILDYITKPDVMTRDANFAPIHLCCLQGHLEVAKLLLQHPASNIDVMSSVYGTPLHCA